MKEGWIKIYDNEVLLQVKLAEDILKQNGIESHITNKPDSIFPSVGAAELYTPADKAEAALAILKAKEIT